MPSWVSYSLIRFGLFALVFAGLLLIEVPVVIAAVIAAIAGFCVAYIFFRPQRDAVARDLAARRQQEAVPAASDEDAEDAPAVPEAPVVPPATPAPAAAPDDSERDGRAER